MRLLVRRSEVGCRRLRLDLAQWVNFGVSSCPYRPQTPTTLCSLEPTPLTPKLSDLLGQYIHY